jgi:hypothetical protein
MTLKLGTETGSLMNHLMSGTNGQPHPQVGMGATILGWTDRHAATIVEVSPSGKTIVIQRDNAKRIDSNGMSESQQYEFTPNADAERETFRLRKTGEYRSKYGANLRIGERSEYFDYSF